MNILDAEVVATGTAIRAWPHAVALLLAHVSHRVRLLVVIDDEVGAVAVWGSVVTEASVAERTAAVAVGSSVVVMEERVGHSFMICMWWVDL